MSSRQLQADATATDVDSLVAQIEEISSLPQVALRVMEVANDAESSASDLKQAMENDMSLCARVLRCVNSSAYALRTRVTNLQQAIAYLGTKQIRNLAMTASVSELFSKNEKIGPYSRAALWRHNVAVGICSRMICMRRRIDAFEDAFLAGLLHDIGIVLEDQHVHAQFADVIHALTESRSLTAIEREHLGFDHATIGGKLAEKWGFPETVSAAIRWHHMAVGYRGEAIDVVRCVEVANLLCTAKGISSVGVKLVKPSAATMTGLSLTRQDVIVLAEDLERELATNASLFTL